MKTNGCLKLSFSKLDCEEISSIYLRCGRCDVFDIPENAEVITICFSPNRGKRCPECYITDEECLTEGNSVDIIEWEGLIPNMRPAFPEYYISRARLRSFDDWPKSLKQTPKQLSEAGFFYTQKQDRVICFCCGGGLFEWEEQDVPWEQHALHHDKCDYLRLVKGLEYISMIKKKLAADEVDIPVLSKLFLKL